LIGNGGLDRLQLALVRRTTCAIGRRTPVGPVSVFAILDTADGWAQRSEHIAIPRVLCRPGAWAVQGCACIRTGE